jgi:hypothetical protein
MNKNANRASFTEPKFYTDNPKQLRLLEALNKGAISREQADKVNPGSNSQDVVRRLREKGLEVPCERVPFVTKYGRSSWYGRYSLTTDDQKLIRKFDAYVNRQIRLEF